MVPQNWIIDRFKMYKIAEMVIKFIKDIMKNWRVELTVGGKNLAGVKIQREILQGDMLSSLQFVIVMIPLNHILRKSTGDYKLNKL